MITVSPAVAYGHAVRGTCRRARRLKKVFDSGWAVIVYRRIGEFSTVIWRVRVRERRAGCTVVQYSVRKFRIFQYDFRFTSKQKLNRIDGKKLHFLRGISTGALYASPPSPSPSPPGRLLFSRCNRSYVVYEPGFVFKRYLRLYFFR